MLLITVEGTEIFDEKTNEFVSVRPTRLQLEHSLVSVAKWEGKHHKSFMKNLKTLTPEELISYIECMNMTQNVSPEVFRCLSVQNLQEIQEYINDPMTATVLTTHGTEQQNNAKQDVVTAELIYYWMIAQNIPMECQKWHLNRLMALIRVCASKNAPPKKMSKAQAMAYHKGLNAQRRGKKHH